jgi:hypothetical protein
MKLLLTIFFILTTVKAYTQDEANCDSIKIYNSDFDKVFSLIYNTIDADSILAVRHCFSTNGCSNSFGVLCWKKDNLFHFKKIEQKNGKTILTDKVDKKLRIHLIEFYGQKVYSDNSEIDIDNTVWIDDGPLTLLRFKTDNMCWTFNHTSSKNKTDARIKWVSDSFRIRK